MTTGLEQIQEIQKDIVDLEATAAAAQTEADKATAAVSEKYAQMRDTADSLSGDFKLNGSPQAAIATAARPAAKKRRGRPKGSKNKTTAKKKVAVKKKAGKGAVAVKRGRPKGSGKKAAGKKITAASPMVKACLAILGDKRKWKKFNHELPTGSEGLSVVELRRAIKGNELWPEEAIVEDLHAALETLKDQNKIERIEGRRIKALK